MNVLLTFMLVAFIFIIVFNESPNVFSARRDGKSKSAILIQESIPLAIIVMFIILIVSINMGVG